MPEFTNPFIGNVPRQMSHNELTRAIMLNIAAELEAIHVYRAHADATDSEDAKKVLLDVALEEMVHAGEFTALLYRLDPTAAQKVEEGFAEVRELLAGSPMPEAPLEDDSDGESEVPIPQGLTVGSLLGMDQ